MADRHQRATKTLLATVEESAQETEGGE